MASVAAHVLVAAAVGGEAPAARTTAFGAIRALLFLCGFSILLLLLLSLLLSLPLLLLLVLPSSAISEGEGAGLLLEVHEPLLALCGESIGVRDEVYIHDMS